MNHSICRATTHHQHRQTIKEKKEHEQTLVAIELRNDQDQKAKDLVEQIIYFCKV